MMDLEFQNIQENGGGKIFAILADEPLPVGQLFYNIDNSTKQIVINYVYIPRKYWSQNGIRESLFAEMQNLYPDYSIVMKEDGQREASLLKESPARSKSQFRYMQGICNGSIEPPSGMTRAQACEYVEGQKNYKKLPEKRKSSNEYEGKDLLMKQQAIAPKWNKKANEYTHLNEKGKPCNCKFYKPDSKESKWKTVLASKLDKIIKDDPKVLRTDEGKKVLEWMKGLPEQVDDLLPWMVREYKKRRLVPAMAGDDVIGMERTVQEDSDVDEIADGTLLLDGETLSHWADWFNSTSPTRRGVDIMQLTTEQFQDKIKEWDEELSSKMEDAVVYEGAGTVVYAFPDGWTMRDVSPEECKDEGDQMGHCVGGHGYPDAIRRGEIKIVSLRDPKNRPHATLEVKSNGHVEQIQGKENRHPISDYRRRVRTFIEDPQGFQNLFKTKAIQSEGRPLTSWTQLGEDISYYDPVDQQQIPPINEEEFGPEWNDPRAPNHPAGQSSYGQGIRAPHYGILPGGTTFNYDSFLSRTDDSSPALINKLYEIAERRGEIPLLQKALENQEEAQLDVEKLVNRGVMVLPNFEDQSRNGWRDVFEKETGAIDYTSYPEGPQKDSAEREYKRLWKEWIGSIYSADFETLFNNLVRINKHRDSDEDRIGRSINQLLGNINVTNQLKSLINKIQYEDPFSAMRPSYGLEPPIQQEQMSLMSKWKKPSSQWKLKKKLSMPKNPEELEESEIITDSFVKNTRFKAFKHGFQDGFYAGWRAGITDVKDSIGQHSSTPWLPTESPYRIKNKHQKDRKISPNQTTFPNTIEQIPESRIDYAIENSRKDLNRVMGLVPSKFLTGGRKYTPSGKQFSKKKFIENLINDYKTMIRIGYKAGFEKAQERFYNKEEIESGFRQGPPEVDNIYNLHAKYMKPIFLEKLEEMDAETFAYQKEKEKIFDEADWDKIYEREVPEDSYKRRWFPTPEAYKEEIIKGHHYRNISDLEEIKNMLKLRESRRQ